MTHQDGRLITQCLPLVGGDIRLALRSTECTKFQRCITTVHLLELGMALIDCPECGKQVSTAAQACPNCGYPVAERVGESVTAQPAMPIRPGTGEPLAQVRPSWWGYFWHLFFFWLIVPPLIAWWRRASVVLQIYPGLVRLERGLFSKCYREFMIRDIRAIDIDQSFLARLVDIGDLNISTAATVDAAETIKAIPHPKAIRDLILEQRQQH